MRRSAVTNLTDQVTLANIAAHDTNPDVREAAGARLEEVRKAASAKARGDQMALAMVALHDRDPLTRRAALARLTDQTALATVAVAPIVYDTDGLDRRDALNRLTDQALLAKMALEANEAIIRWIAVGGVRDQTVLAKEAVRLDTQGSEHAVKQLTDQTLLAKVFVDTSGDEAVGVATSTQLDYRNRVHTIALQKLTAPALLVKTALNGRDSEKPTDEVLAKLAGAGGDENLRYAAAGGVQNLDVLERIPPRNPKDRVKNIVALRRLLAESGAVKEPVWIFLKRYDLYQSYVPGPGIDGETVDISIISGERTVLAQKSWGTKFPQSALVNTRFIAAQVDLNDLLLDLRKP